MCGTVILIAVIVAGRRKNAKIYIIERAKKMSIRRKHSKVVVPGKKHTAYNQKLKNFM
jgi:hypothetical protein